MAQLGVTGPAVPPVVADAWLAAHHDDHDDHDVVLADVRWYLDGRSGRAAYDAGHLPGAVFVDLERWLTGPGAPTDGRHPLPSPTTLAEGLGALGIGEDDVVVAYDDAGGTVAGRLVWLLRATGHRAALLDGGLRTWTGPLSTEPVRRATVPHAPRPWPAHLLVDADEVARLVDGEQTVLLDARAAERFRGEVEPVDPRAGHVPGAVSLPATDTVGPDGRLLPVADLRRRFAAAGVGEGSDVVASCGSGVTACHTLLVLEHAGLGTGRLFPGSFSAWSSDPAREVATGG